MWQVLSQGERQRVLIARALNARIKMLILDEPCAGLDPVARTEFLSDCEQLLKTPRCPSVVFITHHVEEIIPSMSHALILGNQRVVAQGPIRSTLTSAHCSVAFNANVSIRKRGSRYQLTVGA